MTSKDISIGPNGGSMHFIIGDVAGTYDDNSGELAVSVYSLSQ